MSPAVSTSTRSRNRAVSMLLAAALTVAGLALVTTTTTAEVAAAAANNPTADHALRIVSKYKGVWSSAPSDLSGTFDAPYLGNGDIGVMVGGSINSEQTFYVGKNGYFGSSGGNLAEYAQPVGRVSLTVAGMANASYSMTQDIARGELQGSFTDGDTTLKTTTWVADGKSGTAPSVFVISLRLTGTQKTATFAIKNGSGGTPTLSTPGSGVLAADVVSDSAQSQKARMAARVLGTTPSSSNISVTLAPNATYTFVMGVESDTNVSGTGAAGSSNPRTKASYNSGAAITSYVAGLDQAAVDVLSSENVAWWKAYWSKSFVEIDDKAIERSWYGSLYAVGTAWREGQAAPGLWGPWGNSVGNWGGTYFNNYNYQIAGIAGLTSNHAETMKPFDTPVLDYLEQAKAFAEHASSFKPDGGNMTTQPAIFKTGFDGTDTPLSPPATSSSNVTSPSAQVVTNGVARSAGSSLQFSGTATGSSAYAYTTLYDRSASVVPIGNAKALSYWIYPQNAAATCVAIDLTFTDGSNLRDSGAIDQDGNSISPSHQCTQLAIGAWNHVIVNLATNNSGKDISKIRLGYDQPAATAGSYLAYVDDLSVTDYTGAIYPTDMSANGRGNTPTRTWNQKMNGVYLATVMLKRYEYTHDLAYGKSIYPFLRELGNMWAGYLRWNPVDHAYHVPSDTNDTYYECYASTPAGCGSNPDSLLSLSMATVLFRGLADIGASTVGGETVDAPHNVDTWKNFRDHMAPFPTAVVNGKTVFNTYSIGTIDSFYPLILHAMYPAGLVNIDSSEELRAIARNTVVESGSNGYDRWNATNQSSVIYPAAAAVGLDPTQLLSRLRIEATTKSYPNMRVNHEDGGGLETANNVPTGVNAMLLQSTKDTVQVFADWPVTSDAKFGDLLAVGGFTVSSSLKNSAVEYVRVISQAGQRLQLRNPWPSATSAQLFVNGVAQSTVTVNSGGKFAVDTSQGSEYTLAPAGTTAAAVNSAVAAPLHATDVALGKTATQSTTAYGGSASRAVDGNTDGTFYNGSVTHTNNTQANPWWQVDLGMQYDLSSVEIWNRSDCCGERLSDYWVFLSDSPLSASLTPTQKAAVSGVWSSHQTSQAGRPTTIDTSGAHGRYLMVQLSGTDYLTLAEVKAFGTPTNLALGKTASQSTTAYGGSAARAVDGNTDGVFYDGSVTHTNNTQANPWWQVDLGTSRDLTTINVWNRTDCCGERLGDYWVFVSNSEFNPSLTPTQQAAVSGVWSSHQTIQAGSPTVIVAPTSGRYIMVQLSGTDYLNLAEVQAFGG